MIPAKAWAQLDHGQDELLVLCLFVDDNSAGMVLVSLPVLMPRQFSYELFSRKKGRVHMFEEVCAGMNHSFYASAEL